MRRGARPQDEEAMDAEVMTIEDAVETALHPIVQLDGTSLDDWFVHDADGYRLSHDYLLPEFCRDSKTALGAFWTAMRYTELITSCVSVKNKTFSIDTKRARQCIRDAFQSSPSPDVFEDVARYTKAVFGSEVGLQYLAGLLLSEKKNPDFQESDMMNRIMLQTLHA